MRSTFSFSTATLIATLFMICALLQTSVVSAQQQICQGCLNDATHAVPSCGGLDLTKKADSFSQYPKNYQQCLCNLGFKGESVFDGCKGQCPGLDLSSVVSVYQSMYAMYCNGTAMANMGPSTSAASSLAPYSTSLVGFSGLVAVGAMLATL
ncbi:hypothetical protein EMPS_01874 [Entomortierella parvispora]|uniref:Uncharacterized protein n=1 Tax=Entomortierella parvispora TaxID=205924 RepID=A0A9P3H3Q5_9FUNG|nr:hypothetical protein EMPS_01874 [Entomortierella parvispora]